MHRTGGGRWVALAPRVALALLALAIVGGDRCDRLAAQTTDDSTKAKRYIPPPPLPLPELGEIPDPPPLEEIAGEGDGDLTALQRNQLLLGRPPERIPPPPVGSMVRVIFGLAALGVLAYAAGSARLQALERRIGVAHLMTTGLPFALLGLIASQPQIDVLTESVLQDIAPVLPLGLGWVGFVVGARLEAREFHKIPANVGISVFVLTVIPVALLAVALAQALSAMRHLSLNEQLVRDSLLLATAGVIAARRTPKLLSSLLHKQSERIRWIVDFEQLAGIFGLMFISAFYRPGASLVSWVLPGTGWLFVTLGIGTAIGILLYAAFAQIQKGPQFAAILLGSVAFTAGMASYLRLSSLAVCFIAGAICINLGGAWTQSLTNVLVRMERPIYFLFMIIAGALWRPSEWQGWALMVIFVSVRFLSKWMSVTFLQRFLVPEMSQMEAKSITYAPLGALSVAIVISAQDLYARNTDPSIVTAVLGGALVGEFVVQWVVRRAGREPDNLTGLPVEPEECEVR